MILRNHANLFQVSWTLVVVWFCGSFVCCSLRFPVSIQNCSCYFISQPLDHFASSTNETFLQRYCVYDTFHSSSSTTTTTNSNHSNTSKAPIFFYTGNESPIEAYINHTGLMWTLGETFGATLIFAEHRFEGRSVPYTATTPSNCNMAYCTSTQALADYVTLLSTIHTNTTTNTPRPVIAFGGSYGGMLAAWMRIKYPFAIVGALSSSAPLWGFPLTNPILDGGSQAIAYSVLQSSSNNNTNVSCYDNLLASWPLIMALFQSHYGRQQIRHIFHLCHELEEEEDAVSFVSWLQMPWFYFAEGNYPFSSNYIPFALLNKTNAYLPPWPIQAACHSMMTMSNLKNTTILLSIQGDKANVNFTLQSGTIPLLHVDWETLTITNTFHTYIKEHWETSGVGPLLMALYNAISIWYNITQEETCYNWQQSLSTTTTTTSSLLSPFIPITNYTRRKTKKPFLKHDNTTTVSKSIRRAITTPPTLNDCNTKIAMEGCWNSVYCNEGMHLSTVEGRGMGKDFFWPPTYARGTTIQDLIATIYSQRQDNCKNSPIDPTSKWLNDYYGGLRSIGRSSSTTTTTTNIIFTNGLFDPWSAAGVYTQNPYRRSTTKRTQDLNVVVQNITKDASVLSILLPLGAHHLDLMFPTDNDPKCVVQARTIQKDYIAQWIKDWNDMTTTCVTDFCV